MKNPTELPILSDVSSMRNPACASSLLSALFPPGISAAELRIPGEPSLLFAEEARHLGAASVKRAREFAAGRLCARRALAENGSIERPLEVENDHQPSWPPEFTGSITHADGFCGAVVAKRRHVRSLGLDAEVVGDVSPEIWPEILTPIEALWIGTLPFAEQLYAAASIFSAKEAFFKCQFAITGEWLDFQAVAVSFSDRESSVRMFSIRPLIKMSLLDQYSMPLEGRFAFNGNLVLTGIALYAT